MKARSIWIRLAWSSSTKRGPPPTWPVAEDGLHAGSACALPFRTGHWKTTTFVAGLRQDGIVAPFVLDGPINRHAFERIVTRMCVVRVRLLRSHMVTISYARHQFPPEVIRHAVWLYLRFTLSYRDVEDPLS